jgi:SAM-dependent methyltransferase
MSRVAEYFASQAAGYHRKSLRFPWAWSRAREARAVRLLGGAVAGLDVLELGAGAGFYTRELIRRGARWVWAVDLSAAMLAGLPRGPVTPIVGDAATICLGRGFPLVLSSGMLEFVEDPASVLANAARHAEPGARFVVLAPRRSLLGYLYRWFHRFHGMNIHLFCDQWFERVAPRQGWRVSSILRVPPFSLAVQMFRV